MSNAAYDEQTVFYGPHECASCGASIVKASREDGGIEFDAQPSEAPIYPNAQWSRHKCPGDGRIVPSVIPT